MLHIHTFRKHFLEGVYFPVSILIQRIGNDGEWLKLFKSGRSNINEVIFKSFFSRTLNYKHGQNI